eukprot:gene16710-5264_t
MLLPAAALAAAAGAGGGRGTVRSITQYNVTFHFAAPVVAGQYATGDWWVAAPAVVAAIDPPRAAAGRDGWQLNPSDVNAQGLDDR